MGRRKGGKWEIREKRSPQREQIQGGGWRKRERKLKEWGGKKKTDEKDMGRKKEGKPGNREKRGSCDRWACQEKTTISKKQIKMAILYEATDMRSL